MFKLKRQKKERHILPICLCCRFRCKVSSQFIIYKIAEQLKKSCFVFHQGFQTPRNDKSTPPFIFFSVFGTPDEKRSTAFSDILHESLATIKTNTDAVSIYNVITIFHICLYRTVGSRLPRAHHPSVQKLGRIRAHPNLDWSSGRIVLMVLRKEFHQEQRRNRISGVCEKNV